MKLDSSQTILVVEDSDDDYEVMMDAFNESDATHLKNPVVRCEDGKQALNYLLNKPPYTNHIENPTPGIILLDLNLPGVDGRKVLTEIKNNDRLKKIPVIILTTSNDSRDIDACYSLGANTYIQKPVNLDKFLQAIKRLKEYWFEVAILSKE